jgi:hypothetical protein
MSHKCCYEHELGDCEGEIKLREALTKYHWDKSVKEKDPNAPFYACESHAQQYVDYWTEMWAEYNQGRL